MTLKEWLESPDLNIDTEEFVRICHEQDKQIQKDIDFLLDEQQSKHEKQLNELNALLNESRAREARLTEAAKDLMWPIYPICQKGIRDRCLCERCRNEHAREVIDNSSALSWLEAREKRAAADELKQWSEAWWGRPEDWSSADLRERAARLRTEADTLEDQFINTTKQGE